MKTKIQKASAVLPVVVMSLILSFAGCKKDMGSGSPDPNEVWIQNNALNPVQMTVSVGSTVLWTNKDGVAHTLSGTAFSSGSIAAGGTYTYQFPVAGAFTYTLDGGATGMVTAQIENSGPTGNTGSTGSTGNTGSTGYVY